MSNKKIEISTMNISVNVLMLDNKRFTKSVYKQLPILRFKRELLENTPENVILMGFVRDDSWEGKSLLVNENGALKRFRYPSFNKNYEDWRNNVESKEEETKYRTICDSFGQIFISC